MGINIVEKIDECVTVGHVLVSVSEKRGLDSFIPALVGLNPKIKLLSTGGTFQALQAILGTSANRYLTQVSDYTGQPETQGGLVKTLDFKIYLGLLTETYNDAHRADLQRTNSVPIDMVVVNLYPFEQTISQPTATLEKARGNIDIGGPCMLRAAAKNFIRVAAAVDPDDYATIVADMQKNNGAVSFGLRFRLAQKAFEHTAAYDRTIAEFLRSQSVADAKECYS